MHAMKPITLADGSFDIRFRKIPKEVERTFLNGVWDQSILPARLHNEMWYEHFSRLLNHAQAGWGKSFTQAASLQEWQMFQRIKANLRRFAAHKQHRMVEELRELKTADISRADWETKAEKVLRRQNRLWLKAELQASTAAAQAAESWQEFERRKQLYPNLRYETAGDERVRESHKALDEIVRAVDDPFWDVYYPPNGWGCRCKVVQTDAPATPYGDGAGTGFTPPAGFRGNVGKTGRLFGEDHPYFNVPRLDAEAIERQAKEWHAAVTKDQVDTWAEKNLVDAWSADWGLEHPVTITGAEVEQITAGPHINQPGRNELLYVLSLLTGNLRALGATGAEGQALAQYHYAITLDAEYFLNLWKLKLDDGAERIGIYSITDKPPK